MSPVRSRTTPRAPYASDSRGLRRSASVWSAIEPVGHRAQPVERVVAVRLVVELRDELPRDLLGVGVLEEDGRQQRVHHLSN